MKKSALILLAVAALAGCAREPKPAVAGGSAGTGPAVARREPPRLQWDLEPAGEGAGGGGGAAAGQPGQALAWGDLGKPQFDYEAWLAQVQRQEADRRRQQKAQEPPPYLPPPRIVVPDSRPQEPPPRKR